MVLVLAFDRSKRHERRKHLTAESAAWRRQLLPDRFEPTAYERQRARKRRYVIYAAVYSVAGLVAVGKVLFWWLQNG